MTKPFFLKNKYLAVTVLAVIAVSGCVSNGSTNLAGNGVSILNFEPDFPEVFSNEPVTLQLRVQNQGESRARNVQAELTGIDATEWGSFAGFTFLQDMGDLLPFDEQSNTPGEIKLKDWRLKAPDLARGQEFPYSPIVKVSYDYKTTALKPVTIVDIDELRRIQQQGRTLPTGITTYTAGPISVEIRTGNYVKSSTDFGDVYDIFPVYVNIENKLWESGGTTVPGSFGTFGPFGTEFNYPIRVSVRPPSGTTFVYSGFGDDCSSFSAVLDLFRGKRAELTCELQVTNPPSYSEERTMTIEVEYRYQVEGRTTVKVRGTEKFGF